MQRILRPYLSNSQYLFKWLERVPDYEAVFGGDPRPAFIVLLLAGFLNVLGWIKLSKTKSLRYLAGSQLLVSLILTFMGLQSILYSPARLLSVGASIIGLFAIVFSSTPQNQTNVSQTCVYAWGTFFALPGLGEAIEGAELDQAMALLIFIVFGVTSMLFMLWMSLTISATLKDKFNRALSSTVGASIITTQTLLLVLSQLG